jgi:hypothetical protein
LHVQGYRERVKHSHPATRLAVPEQTNGLASRLVAIPPRVIDVVLAGFLVFWTAVDSTNDG